MLISLTLSSKCGRLAAGSPLAGSVGENCYFPLCLGISYHCAKMKDNLNEIILSWRRHGILATDMQHNSSMVNNNYYWTLDC